MIEGISKQTIENFNRMSENRKIVLVGLVNENVKKAMSLFDNIECIIDGDTERCGLQAGRLADLIHMTSLCT